MTKIENEALEPCKVSAAFTKGPWMRDGISVTVERPAGEARPCIAIAHPQTYLSAPKSCEAMKANARLIAAAPELYEALDDLIAWIDGDYPEDSPESRRIMAGKLALAKVRGEA